jgi:RecA-family ATPase
MRVLHSAEENDNTEMQKIIDILNHIQSEANCSICLIHHDNKREDATLTERARGASAIAGWAEFICGIKVVEETDWTREFACELKAAMAPDKFYWRIIDTADDGIEMCRVNWEPPKQGRRKAKNANQQDLEIPF